MYIQSVVVHLLYEYVGPNIEGRYRNAANYAPVHPSQFTPILPAARSPQHTSTLDPRSSTLDR